jgi:hypothetical protein
MLYEHQKGHETRGIEAAGNSGLVIGHGTPRATAMRAPPKQGRPVASGRAALSRHASAEAPVSAAISHHAPAWGPWRGPHGHRTSLVLLAVRGPWGSRGCKCRL